MTLQDELYSLLSEAPLTSAQLREQLCQGECPALLAELQRRSGVQTGVPSAQLIGNAMRALSTETGLVCGAKGGHHWTVRWSVGQGPAETPKDAPAGNVGAGKAPPPNLAAGCCGKETTHWRPSNVDLDSLDRLVKATRRTLTFSTLCDKLDMSPSRVRRLVDLAQRQGYSVNVAGDVVAWKEPEPPSLDDGRQIGVAPTVGGRSLIALLSDTHFGSKYCLRQPIREFIHYAYDRGARHFLHAGDLLDGCYKHGQWELSHHGLDEQMDDANETIPRLPGATFFMIGGNHDQTFWDLTGADVGRAVVSRWREFGRSDLVYLGPRQAMVHLGNVKIELWHPKKGGAYALSYHLQNHIRDYGLGHKPDILVAGHWHTYCYLEQRGVHALAAGTFQGGGSAFSKSLGGAPSIGGTLLSWETTEHGTLRRVAVERSAYYEIEQPRVIEMP